MESRCGQEVELAISESGQMSASLLMSIRLTLPSDLAGRLFSSIALSHALISIISIHKAQS
jgi:hypothetical protein